MGLFTEFLNIRPWEMELLTEKQFTTLRDYADGVVKRLEQ